MTVFEEYRTGEKRHSYGRTVTEADIVTHAGQTGDFYPHHMDAEFCATQSFGQRMAHGTLVLSMAIGMLAGGEINDDAMSYGYDRVRFIKPVFIGDTIRATAEIVELLDHPRQPERYGMAHERVEVVNQHGQIVLALTKIYVINRRAFAAAKSAAPDNEREN